MESPAGVIRTRAVGDAEVHGPDDLVGLGEADLFGRFVAGDEEVVVDDVGPAVEAESAPELSATKS